MPEHSFRRVHYKPFANRKILTPTVPTVVPKRKQNKTYKNMKLSKPVATLVQRRIEKGNPTKFTNWHQRRYQFSNLISQAPTSRINNIIPDIAQGTERNDRQGAVVTLKNINIKGRVDIPADDNPPIGNSDRAQIYVRLMVLSVKKQASRGEIENTWNSTYNDFVFKDNSAPFAPTGQYSDMLSNINRETFTVHKDMVMKLNRYYPYSFATAPGDGATLQRPVSREFNFNLKCRNKKLQYQDPGDLQPQNWQPFVVAIFAYGNGAAPSASGVPFLEYMSHLTFKE